MINIKQYAEENDLNFIGEKPVEIQKQIKAKITEAEGIVSEITRMITNGVKYVQKTLPCFYDHRQHVRSFLDPETGEIVKTMPGELSDRQGDLI